MLSHSFESVTWGMKNFWWGWATPYTASQPPTTPKTCWAIMLSLGTASLNHVPHHWCSGPRMNIHVRMCYPTVLWMLYEAWATSDRVGQPHILHHDLQLHSRHARLLRCLLEPWTWTMHLISSIVVQGQLSMYGNAIPLFCECYIRHGKYLTGVARPIYHIITFNYNPDMLSWYAASWNHELEPCTSSVV